MDRHRYYRYTPQQTGIICLHSSLFSERQRDGYHLISFISSLENGDKQIVSYAFIVKEEETKKVEVLNHHFHSDSSRNLPQFIQPIQSVLSPCLVD